MMNIVKRHFVRNHLTVTLGVSVALIFFFINCIILLAQVGIGTNTPDNSAMLEVQSTDKCLLAPRVILIAMNVSIPINSPASGLFVQ